MATTTPNYGWPVPTSTDYVKDGATAIEALGDAIDATVFGLPTGGDFTLISTTSFSGVSSQSLATNTFTSTYENYKLIFNFTAFSGTNSVVNVRLRASGTDASGATDYVFERLTNSGNSVAGTSFADSSYQLGAFNTTGAARNYKELNLYSPKATVPTSFYSISNYVSSSSVLRFEQSGGYHALSTAYDSISIIPSSGTMTGTVRVYGYSN
jgi:hypothetical protein